jgi:hypothetical protein
MHTKIKEVDWYVQDWSMGLLMMIKMDLNFGFSMSIWFLQSSPTNYVFVATLIK